MSDPNNINAAIPYRTAIAERGKFWSVDSDYLTTLGYPASGEGKYATLTYQVNQAPITLSGDITLGAVELKDETTEDRVNIVPLTNTNAMSTIIVDASGDQITTFTVDQVVLNIGPLTNINNSSSPIVGGNVDVSSYRSFCIHVVGHGSNVDSTVELQHSLDGTNYWATVATVNKSLSGTDEISISNQAYIYLRTVATSVLSGSVSTFIYASNR